MSDGNRFEDKVPIADLMKKNTKELLMMIYIEQIKTNGNIKNHDTRITCLEEDNKHTIKTKIFIVGASILGFIIILFQILDMVI